MESTIELWNATDTNFVRIRTVSDSQPDDWSSGLRFDDITPSTTRSYCKNAWSLGVDLQYLNGMDGDISTWFSWLDLCSHTWTTDDGFLENKEVQASIIHI
jgi:hypothetical protein